MNLPKWIKWSKTEGRYILEEDAFEYVMENYYDEVREQVFEQEAENRQE